MADPGWWGDMQWLTGLPPSVALGFITWALKSGRLGRTESSEVKSLQKKIATLEGNVEILKTNSGADLAESLRTEIADVRDKLHMMVGQVAALDGQRDLVTALEVRTAQLQRTLDAVESTVSQDHDALVRNLTEFAGLQVMLRELRTDLREAARREAK